MPAGCDFISKLLRHKTHENTTAATATEEGTSHTRETCRVYGGADRVLLFRSEGNLAQLGIAIIVRPAEGFSWREASAAYGGVAQANQSYTFQVLSSVVSSFYHREPDLEAIRLVNWGLQSGIDSLIEGNRKSWSELWKSRVLVTGNADDQHALDAAFFYLHSSNHRSNLNGMPPFGLSSTNYLGHSFWDTETWSFPPLLLTSPETAKSLLLFRLRGLDAAKRLAALFGYRGAQFPWEASPIGGEEVTPVSSNTGWAEQHVVLDVALAFWQYQMATQDRLFLQQATWPVLSAVAEWIISRGVTTKRGFEVDNIMGPNESINGLNNSTYVNLACRKVLSSAVQCAKLAGYSAPGAWQIAASSLYLPVNDAGVMTLSEKSPQDAFDDLSFLLPFDCDVDRLAVKRTWQAYQSRASSANTISFVKASEAALLAVMGDRAAAGKRFRESWANDELNPFGMMREAAPAMHGCFLTNEASLLRTAMFGFTGLRVDEGPWNKYDAALPDTWNSIEIERIFVRGEEKRVVARHGRKAEILDA